MLHAMSSSKEELSKLSKAVSNFDPKAVVKDSWACSVLVWYCGEVELLLDFLLKWQVTNTQIRTRWVLYKATNTQNRTR